MKSLLIIALLSLVAFNAHASTDCTGVLPCGYLPIQGGQQCTFDDGLNGQLWQGVWYQAGTPAGDATDNSDWNGWLLIDTCNPGTFNANPTTAAPTLTSVDCTGVGFCGVLDTQTGANCVQGTQLWQAVWYQNAPANPSSASPTNSDSQGWNLLNNCNPGTNTGAQTTAPTLTSVDCTGIAFCGVLDTLGGNDCVLGTQLWQAAYYQNAPANPSGASPTNADGLGWLLQNNCNTGTNTGAQAPASPSLSSVDCTGVAYCGNAALPVGSNCVYAAQEWQAVYYQNVGSTPLGSSPTNADWQGWNLQANCNTGTDTGAPAAAAAVPFQPTTSIDCSTIQACGTAPALTAGQPCVYNNQQWNAVWWQSGSPAGADPQNNDGAGWMLSNNCL